MAYYLCKDTTYFRFTHKTFCSNPALCLKSQIGQNPASDKQDICNFAPNSKNHPTTMKELFLVFLGGGAGSVCRYLASLLIGRNIASAFPWPTLSVNLFGCLLIGLLYTLSERCSLAQEYRLLLTVGLCGGFTTFSTFSNEALLLLRSGMHWQFACYVCGSVALGLAGVFAGLWAGGKILQA